MKKNIHSREWQVVIFTMSFRFECDHAKIASSQMTESVDTKIKSEARKFIQKKNSIEKCSSHSMSSLFNYWNSSF
jgi:hypothetical protein